MSDLVISNVIKVILIVLVVAACAILLGVFFKQQVINFFKGFTLGNSSGVFLALIN